MTAGACGVGCGVCADDHARIKLKVESSPSRSDYINASPIVSGPGSCPHLSPVFLLLSQTPFPQDHHSPPQGPGIVEPDIPVWKWRVLRLLQTLAHFL